MVATRVSSNFITIFQKKNHLPTVLFAVQLKIKWYSKTYKCGFFNVYLHLAAFRAAIRRNAAFTETYNRTAIIALVEFQAIELKLKAAIVIRWLTFFFSLKKISWSSLFSAYSWIYLVQSTYKYYVCTYHLALEILDFNLIFLVIHIHEKILW